MNKFLASIGAAVAVLVLLIVVLVLSSPSASAPPPDSNCYPPFGASNWSLSVTRGPGGQPPLYMAGVVDITCQLRPRQYHIVTKLQYMAPGDTSWHTEDQQPRRSPDSFVPVPGRIYTYTTLAPCQQGTWRVKIKIWGVSQYGKRKGPLFYYIPGASGVGVQVCVSG